MAFITKGRALRGSVLALAAMGCFAIGATDARADMAAEQSYEGYYRMISAAGKCRYPAIDARANFGGSKVSAFADDAQSKFAAIIDGKVAADLGAGTRLHLIQNARVYVNQLAQRKGCDSAEVSLLLNDFETEFGSVVR